MVGTPVLTFLGSLAALGVSRLRDREIETRSKREETLRNLRWAAELSASEKGRLATLGVAELEALLESDLLEENEKIFVEAAFGAVYEDPEAELDQLGGDAEAVHLVVDDERVRRGDTRALPSEPEPEQGDENDG